MDDVDNLKKENVNGFHIVIFYIYILFLHLRKDILVVYNQKLQNKNEKVKTDKENNYNDEEMEKMMIMVLVVKYCTIKMDGKYFLYLVMLTNGKDVLNNGIKWYNKRNQSENSN